MEPLNDLDVTLKGIAALKDRLQLKTTKERLQLHLEHEYGGVITSISALDIGVFCVEWNDGTCWTARLFPPERPEDAVRNDESVLRLLTEQNFPSERCAHAKAISSVDGYKVLVTVFVQGTKARAGPKTLRRLGAMLGRLNKIALAPDALTSKAGAWHHMSLEGGVRQDIELAKALLEEKAAQMRDDEKDLYKAIQSELDDADDFADLPQALIHPDFVPANVIVPEAGGLVVIDWTGAGRGPRVLALGFLLFAAGARELARVDEVMAGYSMHIQLESNEIARLEGAIWIRPFIIRCWELFVGRKSIRDVVSENTWIRENAQKIAARARQALET